MNGEIRLLIVDAHAHEVEGFTQLLQRVDFVMVVGETASAQAAIQQALSLRPDGVLLDLAWRRDRTAGASAVRQIAAALPGIKILDAATYAKMIELARTNTAAPTVDEVPPYDRPALAAGSENGREFEASPAPEAPPGERLTQRELDVLKLIAQGETDARIASNLGIHMTTVKKHVSRILAKLAVSSRAGATAAAYERGILHPGAINS